MNTVKQDDSGVANLPKIGIITDGISRDFEHAIDTMVETGLEYVELQYLWDKQVGELTDSDVIRVKGLIKERKLKVSCISHHNLSGIPLDTSVSSTVYRDQLDTFTTLHRNSTRALIRDLLESLALRKRWFYLVLNR